MDTPEQEGAYAAASVQHPQPSSSIIAFDRTQAAVPSHGKGLHMQTWWAYGGKGMGYAPWAFRAKGGKGGKMMDEHGGRYIPGGYLDPYGNAWP